MVKVEEIFTLASELTGMEREAFLDQNCETDEIRKRVGILLAAHDRANDFLETPPVELDHNDHQAANVDTKNELDDQTIVPFLQCLESSSNDNGLGRLGNYEIESVIGQGGMGVVFKAHDTKLNRRVAIKMLPLSLSGNSKMRRRFLREAESAAQISHPNIVTVHSIEDSAKPYIVMELVPGESLYDRLQRVSRLPVKEILSFSKQIASALCAAHDRNIIHRDIKPANVLIDPEGNVKVADFGLARSLVDTEISNNGDISGTPQFMSPEQTLGEQVDHRTDLFSLGAVMYAMCTGRSPFCGDDMLQVFRQVQTAEPASIQQLRSDVSPELEDVIRRLLSKSPKQRFQSAQEAVKALEAMGDNVGVKSAPGKPRAKTSTRSLTKPILVAAAMIVVLFGISEVSGLTHVSNMLMDVVRVKTPDGTLIIKVEDPEIEVTIDGERISISDGDSNIFHFKPGDYKVEAKKDGKVVLEKIVSVERDGKEVVSIELEPHKIVNEIAKKSAVDGEAITFKDQTQFVLSVRYSPDGSKLASCEFGGRIKVRDLGTEKIIFEDRVPKQNPGKIRFSPAGERLVCGTYQWNVSTGKRMPDRQYSLIDWSPDGGLYATSSAGNTIRICDESSDQLKLEIETNQSKLNTVAFSPDNRFIATAGDENLKVWDLRTGKRIALLHKTPKGVHSVAFSPDGTKLLSGGGDHKIRIWDVDRLSKGNDTEQLVLAGHQDNVYGFAFLPGGKRFVSVSRESAITYPKPGKKPGQTIKFWALDSGEELWNQSGHMHNVTDIDIHPDGTQIATSSYDKTIKLWNLVEEKK